uniref:Uncharacterized protein n=1 Tax=Bombyx mori TaxID=7091 RepID=A0A8R2M6L1_BOMMO|nr:uncharacterized protein LOC119630448 [Bombyx mori]
MQDSGANPHKFTLRFTCSLYINTFTAEQAQISLPRNFTWCGRRKLCPSRWCGTIISGVCKGNQVTPTADHILEMSGKRRNCVGCYEKLRETMKSSEVKRKVKKIKTYCRMCKQNLCAKCFKDSH